MCLIYQELVNASGRSTGQSYQVSVVPFTAQSWIERAVSGKSWCNSSLFSKATLIYIGLRSSGTHSSIPTAQNWNKGNKQTNSKITLKPLQTGQKHHHSCRNGPLHVTCWAAREPIANTTISRWFWSPAKRQIYLMLFREYVSDQMLSAENSFQFPAFIHPLLPKVFIFRL